MPEEELTQVSELWQRIVSKACCLIAFLAVNSDTYVCRLNHVYIVGTITDRHRSQTPQFPRAHVLENVGHRLSFLCG